ncbi:uncharacterized protein LOC121186725 [Toxotes jaculatrix]|uniref:uncharacterized protein LOC121186725 n=1 Tax=Toxotes jaculatrix TaxID=941984 RepID=UPI001B3A9ED7|nr:uncharacterized protein LOC121186725 [Toxotes jaculatrix]
MARAETAESVGETGGGGNGPLPRHNTCRMELPHAWPGLLTTTTITSGTGIGAIQFHRNHHHHLHPFRPLYLSHSLPDDTQTHQRLPAMPSPAPPPTPLCSWRGEGAVTPSALSVEESGSDREELQEAPHRQWPLPDLLPQNEHPSRGSAHHRATRREAVHELEVRRVASQLRAIGDEFNTTVLRRADVAPHWQDWRDACRGLLNFITQTLSTLYRLT